MNPLSRRRFMAFAAGGTVALAAGKVHAHQQPAARPGKGNIENTGDKPLRFLERFKSDYYADLSLNQWLALTPPALVKQHLHLDEAFMNALNKTKTPIVG